MLLRIKNLLLPRSALFYAAPNRFFATRKNPATTPRIDTCIFDMNCLLSMPYGHLWEQAIVKTFEQYNIQFSPETLRRSRGMHEEERLEYLLQLATLNQYWQKQHQDKPLSKEFTATFNKQKNDLVLN